MKSARPWRRGRALEMLRNSPLDATQHQHVELADNASHLLMEIIGDVLDFSRLEAGQLAVEAIPFSIRELFDQVLPIFSPGARRRGLTLDLCIAREVAAEFVGDPVRIKQIVINLVGNAVKFTATGGDRGVGLRRSDLARATAPASS